MLNPRIFTLFVLVFPAFAQGAATLEEMWQHFRTTARNGDWVAAGQVMYQLDAEFSGDRLYEAPEFQKAYLPLRALVLMEQQRFNEAENGLLQFKQTEGVPQRQVAWARFSLARIAQADGRTDQALERFTAFANQHPELTEAQLAQWFIAELKLNTGNSRAAMDLHSKLSSEPSAPVHLREQARLRKIQIAVQNEDLAACLEYLDDLQLELSNFPERLQANFTALELQQFLRSQGQHKAALRASMQIKDYPLLLANFADYLASLRQNWTVQGTHWRRQAPIWGQHLQRRIELAENSFASYAQMEPYTFPWLMGRGLSFLESGYPWLADRLFEHLRRLSERPDSDASIGKHSADLLYLSILCRQEIRDWSLANERIENFYRKFADDPRLPDVRFAQARGASLQGMPDVAYVQLNHLIEDYPQHSERISWLWMRAQVEAELGKVDQSLASYDSIHRQYPEHRLIPYILLNAAELALARHYEREAHALLDALESRISSDHNLIPYSYWIRLQLHFLNPEAAAFNALRDQFLLQWSGHTLEPELLNLAGDRALQEGHWQQALSWYQQIHPENALAFEYALFQQVTIFRKTEQADRAWALLSEYSERAIQGEPQQRLQEAIFTLNRLSTAVSREQQWRQQLEQLIYHLGNQQAIDDFSPFLQAWRQSLEQDPELNFESWLKRTEIEAEANYNWSLWSRLQLFKHPYNPDSEASAAEAMLLRIHLNTPTEALDAQALFRIGAVLADQQFDEGIELLKSVVRHFPRSHWTPRALKALAEHRSSTPWQARRWWNQLEMHWTGTEEALWATLELAFIEANESDLNSAIDRLGKLIERRNAPAQLRAKAWYHRAEFLAQSGLPTEAIHHYQRLYTLFPQFTELCEKAYLASARLLFETGHNEAARKTLYEARSRLQLKPSIAQNIEDLQLEIQVQHEAN
ncbi:MAG: tetratricopeptide repeat protein [Opitutales bacterium]|nr:tetratricopeptide repeat protein [Opitutales bacterium]